MQWKQSEETKHARGKDPLLLLVTDLFPPLKERSLQGEGAARLGKGEPRRLLHEEWTQAREAVTAEAAAGFDRAGRAQAAENARAACAALPACRCAKKAAHESARWFTDRY